MSGLYNGAPHGHSRAANAADSAAVNKKRVKPENPGKRITEAAALTDDQVRQMRALFDYRGWSKPELAKHFELNYGVVNRIIDGLTRSKIAHSEADVPRGL